MRVPDQVLDDGARSRNPDSAVFFPDSGSPLSYGRNNVFNRRVLFLPNTELVNAAVLSVSIPPPTLPARRPAFLLPDRAWRRILLRPLQFLL